MLVLTTAAWRVARAHWAGPLCVDLETNGRAPWEPGAVLAGIAVAGQTATGPSGCYVPLAHQRGPNADPAVLVQVVEDLQQAALVAYSLATEAAWTRARWQRRFPWVGDAFILGRLQGRAQLRLKDLAEAVLGVGPRALADLMPGHDFTTLASEDPRVWGYAVQDAIDALLTEETLRPSVPVAQYAAEVAIAVRLAEQTVTGYPLEDVSQAGAVTRAQQAIVEDQIYAQLGRFQLSSYVQLGRRLQEAGVRSPVKTPTGADSWSQEVLEAAQGAHPVLPAVLAWRRASSVLTGLGKLRAFAQTDGRLHPKWRAIGVHGSMIPRSEQPALGLLPTLCKERLVAPPGMRWVTLAWPEAEWAMHGALAGDRTFFAAVTGARMGDLGGDLASLLRGYTPEAVAERSGRSLAEVAALLEAYPVLVAHLARIRQEALAHGTYRTWPWLDYPRRLQKTGEEGVHEATAGVAQQALGVAVKRAAVAIITTLESFPLRYTPMVIPLRDSVSFCLADAEQIPTELLEAMRLTPQEGFTFPLRVGGGRSWGAALQAAAQPMAEWCWAPAVRAAEEAP